MRIWWRTRAANLNFTTDYAAAIPDAQVIFIAVGTPPGAGRRSGPALSAKPPRAASASIWVRTSRVVVNKSTVPIGSGNWVGSLVRDAFQKRNGTQGGTASFAVASNPEFLREGSALQRQPVSGPRGGGRR